MEKPWYNVGITVIGGLPMVSMIFAAQFYYNYYYFYDLQK